MCERLMWLKGDRVKTINEPYVTGIVDEDMGDWVMITEDYESKQSTHYKKDLAVFKKGDYHPVENNSWKEIIGY